MAQVEFIPNETVKTVPNIFSPDLFDKVIDVEFLGEAFSKVEKKLEAPREVTKQEYEALCKTYTNPMSGNTFVFSPKIISRKSKDGPYTISTEVDSVAQERTLCKLECGHGLKPHISLSFKLLPGQLVYHVILKVTNLELPFDVRECASMRIKAGYRSSNLTQSFSMGVFASYIESPGPDDVTTFEGVIVDSLDSFFSTRKVQIELNNTSTVGELLDALERYLPGPRTFSQSSLSTKTGVVSSGIKILREIEPEILKLKVSLGNHTGSFNSGYQALSWAIGLIQDAAKNQVTSDGKPVQIFASVFDTRVLVMDTAHKSAESQYTVNVGVPVIDNIKRATFVGPQLNLIAPWYPPLIPGNIFQMAPNFFNGHQLNNNFDVSTWKPEENTYRVITMEVNFDTVTNQNEMIIVALPTDEGGITEEVAAELKGSDIDASIAQVVNQPKEEETESVRIVTTNQNGEITQMYRYSEGQIPKGHLYESAYGVLLDWVAGEIWPSSIKIEVPYEKELCAKLDGIVGAISRKTNGGNTYILQNSFLWPLIYISTYRKMNSPGGDGFYVCTTTSGDMDFEQSIKAASYSVWAPDISSGEYKQVLAAFKDMKDDVDKLRKQLISNRGTHDSWYGPFLMTYLLLENL